jgi:hypothetical protein
VRALAAIVLLLAACSAPAPQRSLDVPLTDMPTQHTQPPSPVAPGEQIVSWSSSGWRDPWLTLPPETQVTYSHALGREPEAVQVYISFTPVPDIAAAGVGDVARIVEVTPDSVTIWNHSQQAWFVRLVLF